MKSLPPPELCIFDLDGTLVDSLRDIAESANYALEMLGQSPEPIESYRYRVGEGLGKLCEKVLGRQHPELVPRMLELATAHYRTRPLRHTRPYPGVREAVGRVGTAGMRMAVLSNKPHDMTVRIVAELWPGEVFARVQGYTEDAPRKPDPHHLLRICESLSIPAGRTWLVGDTPTDVETARRAGATCIGVTWGFRTRQDLVEAGCTTIIDSPDRLLA